MNEFKLGCDYDSKGVQGVGKENATKFLNEVVEWNKTGSSRLNILELLRSWSRRDYVSNGLKYEDRIRKAVMSNETTFPNEEIIAEYMTFSRLSQILLSQEKYLTIKWIRPNLRECQVGVLSFLKYDINNQSWKEQHNF